MLPPSDLFNEDEHQCQNILHSFLCSSVPPSLSLALSVCLHLHFLTSLLFSCSASCCVGFIHRRGLCALVTASLHVCVSGCVSVDMCMCRMKCRLTPMRHTRRHTHRGGGCCVRRRRGSPAWIWSGFSLFYISKSGCNGIVEYCCSVSLYMCVCVSEGAEQNWKQHCYGSLTEPHHSLSEFSFLLCFSVFPPLGGITVKYVGVGAPFQRYLTWCRYSTTVRSLIHSPAQAGHYVRDREWALCKAQMNACSAHIQIGDIQRKCFPSTKLTSYIHLILHFHSELSTILTLHQPVSPSHPLAI